MRILPRLLQSPTVSLIDRIRECTTYDIGRYVPLEIAGEVWGAVLPSFADVLRPYQDVFERHGDRLRLRGATAGARTEGLTRVAADLRARGRLPEWRGEPYAVVRQWGEEPVCTVERGLVVRLGLPGFGVHLNGHVATDDGLRLWVATRAHDKPTHPGRLDHLVGGGQPAGVGLLDNMIKECGEEAAIPPELCKALEPASTLRYRYERAEGLHQDTVHAFDLSLPPTFEPRNDDGEVAAFELWEVSQVIETLRDTRRFKPNVTLVILDFLLRRGLLEDDAERDDVVAALGPVRGPVHPTLQSS